MTFVNDSQRAISIQMCGHKKNKPSKVNVRFENQQNNIDSVQNDEEQCDSIHSCGWRPTESVVNNINGNTLHYMSTSSTHHMIVT